MGCYPLHKMMPRALRRRKGKQRSNLARTVVVTPPPTIYSGRAVAKSVTFNANNHVITMPPDHPGGIPEPRNYPETIFSPTPHMYRTTVEEVEPYDQTIKEPKQVWLDGGSHSNRRVVYGLSQQEPESMYSGPESCYIASPLPGWEEDERRRRRDYFSRDYHYYPTPIREGIYGIATDAGRLTTMFSEENPNACNII